jgi:MFS family permease
MLLLCPGKYLYERAETVNYIVEKIRDYIHHLRLFTPNARRFLVASFFLGFGHSVFWVLLNLYLKDMGFREGFIGKVASLSALGAVLSAFPIAYLLDRTSMRKLLMFSALAAGTGYTGLSIITYPPAILAASLIVGLSWTAHWIAQAPFFMRNSTPKERVYLFSLGAAIESFAAVVGTLSGGSIPDFLSGTLMSTVWGERLTLLLASGMVTCAFFPFYRVKEHPGMLGAAKTVKSFFALRHRMTVLKLCLPSFIVGMGAGLVIPFLNLYFRSRFACPTSLIGVFFASSQLVLLLGFLVGPLLVRKFGMIRTILLTQLASIPFFLVMAFSYNLKAALIAYLVRAALMNMSHPIATNFAMEIVDEDQQAITNSFLMLAWEGSWAISTNAGGQLIESFGFTLPMLITVSLYVVSSLLYYMFFRKHQAGARPHEITPGPSITPEAPSPTAAPPHEE